MASEQQSNAIAAPSIPEWIKAPLFEPVFTEIHPDFKQTKQFKVSPALSAGENYATVMLRIEAKVELKDGSSKTISLMMKSAPDTDIFRMMMQQHNIFEVESEVYAKMIPEFEQLYKDAGEDVVFGAKCYKLETDQIYILLEDLRPRNFKNANRLEGLDKDHIHCVLAKLAKWHAASALQVSNKGVYDERFIVGMFKEESRPMIRAMFEGLFKVFMECAKSYEGVEEYYDALNVKMARIMDDMAALIRYDPKEFNVLNHGDAWCNNIMFQYDAFGKIKETYLVDFQMPHYGTPAQDLFYFLMSSAKYELKTKQFDSFIKFYHQELVKNLQTLKYSKQIPSLKDIHIMLYKYGIWGFSAASGVMSAVLLDANEDAKAENWIGDSDAGVALKILMYSNARYRKHIEMILPWLYNRGALE